MARLILPIIATFFVSLAAADTTITCGSGTKCPSDTPCCSQYGECGTGEYCLSGCDPVSSFSLDSCAPTPVCKTKSFNNWTNTDDIIQNWEYLGNASANDWWVSGTPLAHDGNLLLTLAPNTTGTLLSYNDYVWYGKVSVQMKTARGAGVVTAFVLMSDVKDEIDVEFIGVDLYTAQTNYFFQGIETGMLEVNGTMSSDSFENFHIYEVDWTPDALTWYIDGKSVRTLQRSDTYNETTKQFWYPQSPSRVQLSVWPGGASTEAPGVIAWAGGEIKWDTPDIKDPGYYYATIGEVNITCYDPPSDANIQGDKSYIYTSAAGTNNTVEVTNKDTVLASEEATGTNVTAGATTTQPGSTSSPTYSSNGSGGSSGSGDRSSSGNDGSSGNDSTFTQGNDNTSLSSTIKVERPFLEVCFVFLAVLLTV